MFRLITAESMTVRCEPGAIALFLFANNAMVLVSAYKLSNTESFCRLATSLNRIYFSLSSNKHIALKDNSYSFVQGKFLRMKQIVWL